MVVQPLVVVVAVLPLVVAILLVVVAILPLVVAVILVVAAAPLVAVVFSPVKPQVDMVVVRDTRRTAAIRPEALVVALEQVRFSNPNRFSSANEFR